MSIKRTVRTVKTVRTGKTTSTLLMVREGRRWGGEGGEEDWDRRG